MKASLDRTDEAAVPTALLIAACAKQSEHIIKIFNQLVNDLIRTICDTLEDLNGKDIEQFEELLMERVHKLDSFDDANDYLNLSRTAFQQIMGDLQQLSAKNN